MPGFKRSYEVKIRPRSYHTFEWHLDKSYLQQLQSGVPTLILPQFLPIFVQRRADCDDAEKKLPDYVSIPIQRNDRVYVDLRLPKKKFTGGSLFEDVRLVSTNTISVKKNAAVAEGDTVFVDSVIAHVERVDEGRLTLDTTISTASMAGWIADTEDPAKTMRNILDQHARRFLPATFFVAGLGGPFQETQYYLWQSLAKVSCVFEGAATLIVDPDFTKTSWMSGDPIFIAFSKPTDIEFMTYCHAYPLPAKTVRYELKYRKTGNVFIGWFMRMETDATCIVSLERALCTTPIC